MSRFRDDLSWAQKAGRLPFWDEEFFPKAFSDFVRRDIRDEDGDDQRDGIDCRVHLRNSGRDRPRVVTVDIKCRRAWYRDILLEAYSDWHGKKPGWANPEKRMRADYIAYANVVTGSGWLLPTLALQEAFRRNHAMWLAKRVAKRKNVEHGGYTLARNSSWTTANVVVEESDLLQAIGDVVCVSFRRYPEFEADHLIASMARFGASGDICPCDVCTAHLRMVYP